MNDVAKRVLEIGDIVAATYVGSPDLKKGRVSRFTPKKIVVEFRDKHSKTEPKFYEEMKFPSQVCFIRKPIV